MSDSALPSCLHGKQPTLCSLSMDDPFGPIRWFDWDAVQRHPGRNLPHYELPGAIYFVTFRLCDSLPAEAYIKLAAARDAFLLQHPFPHTDEQNRQFKRVYHIPLERHLDMGMGQCILRRPDVREIVAKTLLKFDDDRYQLGDFVLMPNHVHLLARTRRDLKLRNTCRQWKQLSATRINALLHRQGRLWQSEPFDHILRGPVKLRQCRQYIADNPQHLRPDDFTLGQGTLFHDPAIAALLE